MTEKAKHILNILLTIFDFILVTVCGIIIFFGMPTLIVTLIFVTLCSSLGVDEITSFVFAGFVALLYEIYVAKRYIEILRNDNDK